MRSVHSRQTTSGLLDRLKFLLREHYDEFMFKYGPERAELARNRLRIHQANIEGKWNFNPYTEPDSDWFDYNED